MQYFKISQDKRIQNYPKIQNININININWENNEALTYSFSTGLFQSGFYPLPFLNASEFLISNDMERIFKFYQIGARSNPIALYNQDTVFFYYIYQPPIIACVHSNSTFYHDHTIKNLILSNDQIGPHKVFQPANLLEKYLIVDLYILEALLSEAIFPFQFDEVETI